MNYNKNLQTLRGISFLFIFLFHSGVLSSYFSNLAVSTFFVLSGFLTFINHSDEYTHSINIKAAVRFSLFKTKKLYPLHILMMTLALFRFVALYLKNGILMDKASELIIQFCLNCLLVQDLSVKYACSLNGVSWYLSAMLFIYIFTPPAIRIINKLQKIIVILSFPSLLILQMIIALLSEINFGQQSDIYTWIIYLNPLSRFVDVFGGIYLGYLCKNKILPKCKTYIIIPAFISILYYGFVNICEKNNIFINLCNPTSLYIIIALSWIYALYSIKDAVKNNYLSQLGNHSANLFLIHNVIIAYVNTFWEGILDLEGHFTFVRAIFSFILSISFNFVYINYLSTPKTKISNTV